MAEGDERMGTLGNMAPYGEGCFVVGPLLQQAALNFRIPVPVGMGAIKVKRVKSFTTVAVTVNDSVVTVKKQHASVTAVAMTGGTLTIAQSGSAAAVEDSCDITDDANARVPAGDFVVLAIAHVQTDGEAIFTVDYEKVQ